MIGGALSPQRTTTDCDVIDVDHEEHWEAIQKAAAEVGKELGLSETWLNIECRIWANNMPLGWKARSNRAGSFGPLRIFVASRIDLIAMKAVSVLKRPQDREDIAQFNPTAEELKFVYQHLDRLEKESLDGEDGKFDRHREYLKSLGVTDEQDE